MKIPIINRFRSKEQFPALAWIIKPMKNGPDIELDRARRIDEKDSAEDLVSKQTRFELKGGGTTAPVPYKHIHKTSEGPMVVFKTPEKGTYVPYSFSSNEGDDQEVETALQALGEVQSIVSDEETIQELDPEELQGEVGNRLNLAFNTLQENRSEDIELENALDNQQWLRWGKNTVMDLKLSWEKDKGFWDKHGAKVILVMAAMLLVVIGIMNYMSQKELAKAVDAAQNIIPIGALYFKQKKAEWR